MVNRNTKYWFFTWEVNSVQRKLLSKEKLKSFLDQIADYAQFQKEIGEIEPREINYSSKNLRKEILKDELKDFERLLENLDQVINMLIETNQFLVERYLIERRNSFSSLLTDRYVDSVLSNEALIEFLKENQKLFYESRIEEIKKELNS